MRENWRARRLLVHVLIAAVAVLVYFWAASKWDLFLYYPRG